MPRRCLRAHELTRNGEARRPDRARRGAELHPILADAEGNPFSDARPPGASATTFSGTAIHRHTVHVHLIRRERRPGSRTDRRRQVQRPALDPCLDRIDRRRPFEARLQVRLAQTQLRDARRMPQTITSHRREKAYLPLPDTCITTLWLRASSAPPETQAAEDTVGSVPLQRQLFDAQGLASMGHRQQTVSAAGSLEVSPVGIDEPFAVGHQQRGEAPLSRCQIRAVPSSLTDSPWRPSLEKPTVCTRSR